MGHARRRSNDSILALPRCSYDGVSQRTRRQISGARKASDLLLADSKLRGWGLNLNEKIGFKRAAVAVARKLAVIMHTILKIGEFFEKTVGAVA